MFNEYIWIYSLESNNTNECVNILKRRKKSWINVRIYLLWKNPQIFEQMNIFVKKYLNIFEYPNICYTLIRRMLVNKNFMIVFCINIRTRGGIYGQIYPFALKEFPRAKPEGTHEGNGVYLTLYAESSPNTDSISF